MKKHLSGLTQKMADRATRRNIGPSPKRIAVPAQTPPSVDAGAHRRKMARKAERRELNRPLAWYQRQIDQGRSARILNRWTGKPHEHKREIARRQRQSARAAQ